jgi:PAS domain S-box-containing protein
MAKARILVVEDEGLTALAIEEYVKECGHEVVQIVATGEDAVRKAIELEVDLVLMDIKLQGELDGLEAANLINSSRHIPVIFVTAYSDDKTLARAKLSEPYSFLIKPINAKAIKAAIEIALYKANSQNKLRRTKEQMDAILGSVEDGVIVAGNNGGIEFFNQSAARMLDLSWPIPVNQTIDVIFATIDLETGIEIPLPLDRSLMQGESSYMSDLLLKLKSGKRIAVDYLLSPYRDETGIAKGVVLTFRDVTDRRTVWNLTGDESEGVEIF